MSREARIGLLGLIGIIMFFILVPSSNTRDSKLLQNTYNFVLSNGNRISEGCDVKLAGYSVGQISAINFATDEDRNKFGEEARIIVTVNTDVGVRIPEDSAIGVDASSSGTVSLNIQPGISQTMLAPNTTVKLIDGYSTEQDKLAKASAMLTKMSTMTKSFDNAVSNPAFKTNMLDLASNARFYTNEAKIMAANIPAYRKKYNNMLNKYEGLAMQQIDRINVQIDMGAKRLQAMRPKLNAKLSGVTDKVDSIQGKLSGMLATAKTETERFKAISEKAEKGANSLMTNPEYRAKLRHAARKLDDLAVTCESIHCVSSDPSVREGLQKLTKQYREESQTIKNKIQALEVFVPGEAEAATPRTTPTPVRVDSSAIIQPANNSEGTANSGA